ncbi:UNVERIFIED_CONTAM: Secreted RxLR effector protein [Sesamum latifolium]|uniref:Secreted RxLR effector protein n=1 Tax=Sesamum latifolium TaxID=2727402 RepID=A0AAW2XQH5_9LAMI
MGLKLTTQDVVPLRDAKPYKRLADSYRCSPALGVLFKGCSAQGLFFPSSNPSTLTAYCDADWASCVDSRRTLTGYFIFLGKALISWKTKKQTTVAHSIAKVEYKRLGTIVFELQWISYLLNDLRVPVPIPILIYCDNQVAIHIVVNLILHECTKYLDIDCHLARDKFKAGFVLPSHIYGKSQPADMFSKLLPGPNSNSFLSKLGLVSFSQVHLEGMMKDMQQQNAAEQQ